MKVLLLDFFDSFTYNLKHYLVEAGADCSVFRCDHTDLEAIRGFNADGIVLSPGPGSPTDYSVLEEILSDERLRIPILGICLGYQAIGLHYGLKLKRGKEPVHGKPSLLVHDGKGFFDKLPQPMQVMRYHSLQLEGQSDHLEICARTESGKAMALRHRSLPICGVQFHPESILTPNGIKLLENWLAMASVYKALEGAEMKAQDTESHYLRTLFDE